MNLYGLDPSLYEYGFADPAMVGSLSRNLSSSFSTVDDDDEFYYRQRRPRPTTTTGASIPPTHHHDGTSPLPLGMEWSLPPRVWDGRESIWPHDPHTGWSYCVTVPSWTILSNARGSDSVVFYRVQVGIQSPQGITTTRGVLRRFNDFVALFAELRKAFPQKKLPPAPSKTFLKKKSRTLLEERRRAFEDWMEKLLSDIDLSRTAPVAIFLELEAAARSSFYDSNQGGSPTMSDYCNNSAYQTSELGTPRDRPDNHAERNMENASGKDIAVPIGESLRDGLSENTTGPGRLMKDFIEGKRVRLCQHKSLNGREDNCMDTYPEDESDLSSGLENSNLSEHVRKLSIESIGSDASSTRASESSSFGVKNSHDHTEASRTMDLLLGSGLQAQSDLAIVVPSEECHIVNRVLTTTQQRLGTAKTDMEDLIARLDQESAVRQYLTTKVKDLEVELETTRRSGKENLQLANLIERERLTQMQWDMEELRRKYMEVELKLKSEEEARLYWASTKESVLQKNEMLLQELDEAREQVNNLKTHHHELDLKSKSEVKLLVKEVKSLRSSQSELKQELDRCLKEILDLENDVQKERERRELANAAKEKLLHECQILRNRLRECSVNFLIKEEDKLILDSTSLPDAMDLLTTSDNRIGLLLAEAQLLAQDVASAIIAENLIDSNESKTDYELRTMLTDIFVDNARLKKQVNSVMRCALNTSKETGKSHVDEDNPTSKTVLGKFL